MSGISTDLARQEEALARRRAWGGDRYDEVWEGVRVMSPHPGNEHQRIVLGLAVAFQAVVDQAGLGQVQAGANVSDRADDWSQDYRVPDVVVYLAGGAAEDRETHWLGGPDLAVEVVSRGDRTHEKLGFYGRVGTRELLVVNRGPWSLELYRLRGGELELAGEARAESPGALDSGVLPLRFGLEPGAARPVLVVEHRGDGRRWRI